MNIPASWITSAATVIGGLVIWLMKLSFERSLEQRDRKAEHEERERDEKARKREAEQKKRDEMILKGLRVLTDCNYEVIYQMQTGHHNGGLDDCMNDITQYRAEINDWILDLASRK